MITYRKLVQLFETIAIAHPNLESYSISDVEEFDSTKQTVFPHLHLNVNNISVSDGLMRYNIDLAIIDKVADTNKSSEGATNIMYKSYKGVSNVIDVIDTSQNTMLDVFGYLKRKSNYLQISLDGLITPVTEQGVNLLAGVTTTLNIDVPLQSNNCVVSLTDYEQLGGTYECNLDDYIDRLLQESGWYLLTEDGSRIPIF